MKDFLLIRPSIEYINEISKYREEFLEANESMDGTGPLKQIEDISRYIEICKEWEDKETVPKHLVPATQFMLVRNSDKKVVGMIQIRHYLNAFLSSFGGHIGYSIAPSERRKGYAKLMLKEVLPFCKKIGIERLLITCLNHNIASEHVIISSGGIYEKTVLEPNMNVNLKRFWIDLSNKE